MLETRSWFLIIKMFACRSLVQPYTLEKYMKDKISSKLEEKRTKRVQVQSKLPTVNKDLFIKLKDLETTKKKAKAANLVPSLFSQNDSQYSVAPKTERPKSELVGVWISARCLVSKFVTFKRSFCTSPSLDRQFSIQ